MSYLARIKKVNILSVVCRIIYSIQQINDVFCTTEINLIKIILFKFTGFKSNDKLLGLEGK